MATALFCSGSALAQANLMEGAINGATGNVGGPDAPLVKDGWQLWKCPFEFDAAEEEYFWDEPENITENWPDNVRIENPSAKGWNATNEDGTAFSGNFAMFRWDGGDAAKRWFVYPVNIEKTGIYSFSCLAGDFNNYNPDNSASSCYVKTKGFRVTVAPEVGPEYLSYEEDYSEEDFAAQAGVVDPDCGHVFIFENGGSESPVMNACETDLTIMTPGTNYIAIQGPWTIMAFADFSLTLIKEIAGVEGIESNTTAVSSRFYGIDGVEVLNPAKGSIVIEKTLMDNGSVKVSKKVVR